MSNTLYHEKWDGLNCSICQKDCWDNRINLAIELAKHLNRSFNMKELYNLLAEEHPPARWCEKRQTPWNTFFRDLYQSPFFEKVGRGMFRLTDKPRVVTKIVTRGDSFEFENNVKKLLLLKEAKLISEEEYLNKGKELLMLIKIGNDGIEKETTVSEPNNGILKNIEISTKGINMSSSWCDDVEEAMNTQPEKDWWYLSEIYSVVEEIRQKHSKPPIRNIDASVRNTLEKNSRGEGKDIFEPMRLGSGEWRLKKRATIK